ncbi:MAG TPA: response regulator [Thermomicrobiales bacterium]|jgi:two-component system response regulator MprA
MGPLIVIAEDDAAILDCLTETLEGEGYHVRRAGDGLAALAQLAAERADLLLTDQQMPRATGLEVIARQPGRVGAPLPIILMSALTLPVPPAAPVVFLQKPFDLDHVVALVRTLLRQA